MPSKAVRVIGPGRAGRSMARGLDKAGWSVVDILGRDDDLTSAASGVDLVVIAVPDRAIAEVAAAVEAVSSTVVAHLSGAHGPDILGRHPRRAAIHPLRSLATPSTDLSGAWFAVAGDPMAADVVADLDGRLIELAEGARPAYHAAATVAANHLVALLGSVERIAASAGVPLEAFVDLVRGTLDNVELLGPAAALTGPVARGDWETVAAHVAAIPDGERRAYAAMADLAARLVPTDAVAGERVQVHETIDGFRRALDAERAAGRTVGLVPTMGYLHDGHASLMRRAADECDVVAATIFVNPLQFAVHEDLSTYPRDLDGDLRLAAASGVTHVFAPSEAEMYPGGRDGVLTTVHVAGPSEGLEGASRPTHFDGVATVVAKLFAIAGACRAYFGEKDWQQLQVVRQLVCDLSLPVEIVGCPIVREADGLAMSSRNVYLSAEQRRVATVLRRALDAGLARPDDPESAMREVVAAEPLADLDYVAVRAGRLLVAVRFGPTRLIDNCDFPTSISLEESF